MCVSARLWSRFWLLALLAVGGCRCSKLTGSGDSGDFKRCAQVDAPEGRTWRAGELELAIEDRVLRAKGKVDALRLVTFTGPVGAALTRHELAQISQAEPQLVLMLGGLGDDVQMAKATLAGLAALRVPSVFIAGGADRLPVVEEAFEELDEAGRDLVTHGSGLRELAIGKDRFAIVPGAPEGRYAIDDTACGFESDDLDDVREHLEANEQKGSRVWLLSWAAPSGFGVTRALGGHDVGSEALAKLAEDIAAEGGLFAFPESAVAQPVRDAQRKGLSLVVPRLGRTGATRVDGGRVVSGVARLSVGSLGLTIR